MAYIEFKDVYKEFGEGRGKVIANNNVSFSIDKGQLVVICGPSGAGKSTVLNILGGMELPTNGKVFVNNKVISEFEDYELTKYRRNSVGFVFQFYNLIPNLTAKENIEMSTSISGSNNKAEEFLNLLNLGERKDNFPSQLSGGEQQRISIGRAIAKNPEILLCDEPTGALDYETGIMVLNILNEESKKRGTTVIIITHNDAITKMADKIIRMKNGKIESISYNDNPVSPNLLRW